MDVPLATLIDIPALWLGFQLEVSRLVWEMLGESRSGRVRKYTVTSALSPNLGLWPSCA